MRHFSKLSNKLELPFSSFLLSPSSLGPRSVANDLNVLLGRDLSPEMEKEKPLSDGSDKLISPKDLMSSLGRGGLARMYKEGGFVELPLQNRLKRIDIFWGEKF